MMESGIGGGNYILQLLLEKGKEVAIGKSKKQFFEPGYYFYVGSALGGGGLQSRIDRHLRSEKKLHWHIDYFLTETKFVSVWFISKDNSIEHKIAAELTNSKSFKAAAERFGSSDCNCDSHLFFSKKKVSLNGINKVLSKILKAGNGFKNY